MFVAEPRAGDPAVLDLVGDLDGTAADEFLGAARSLLQEEPDRLVLSFDRVGYINSSGIAVLVELLRDAQSAGSPVHAVGLSDHYRYVFGLTRLTGVMTVHDGPDDDLGVASDATPHPDPAPDPETAPAPDRAREPASADEGGRP